MLSAGLKSVALTRSVIFVVVFCVCVCVCAKLSHETRLNHNN